MTLNKNTVEKMCRAAQMSPEKRETIRGRDVFIADGFSAQPHITYKRFGVDPGEFPFGCYATIWWIAKGEDHFEVGVPMLFDAFHDPQFGGNQKTKKMARINAALKEASGFLKARKRVVHDLAG